LHIGHGLSQTEQNDWNNRFGPLVKQWWEGKYGFQKNATVLRPEFVIQYTDNMHDAHFVMNVMNSDGGSESIGRDTYYKLKGEDGFLPTISKRIN
jgi:hypothetical protein